MEDDCHMITVYPVHQLPAELMTKQMRSEITVIYNRITGKNLKEIDILNEYPL